jgi:hypothetical protein
VLLLLFVAAAAAAAAAAAKAAAVLLLCELFVCCCCGAMLKRPCRCEVFVERFRDEKLERKEEGKRRKGSERWCCHTVE